MKMYKQMFVFAVCFANYLIVSNSSASILSDEQTVGLRNLRRPTFVGMRGLISAPFSDQSVTARQFSTSSQQDEEVKPKPARSGHLHALGYKPFGEEPDNEAIEKVITRLVSEGDQMREKSESGSEHKPWKRQIFGDLSKFTFAPQKAAEQSGDYRSAETSDSSTQSLKGNSEARNDGSSDFVSMFTQGPQKLMQRFQKSTPMASEALSDPTKLITDAIGQNSAVQSWTKSGADLVNPIAAQFRRATTKPSSPLDFISDGLNSGRSAVETSLHNNFGLSSPTKSIDSESGSSSRGIKQLAPAVVIGSTNDDQQAATAPETLSSVTEAPIVDPITKTPTVEQVTETPRVEPTIQALIVDPITVTPTIQPIAEPQKDHSVTESPATATKAHLVTESPNDKQVATPTPIAQMQPIEFSTGTQQTDVPIISRPKTEQLTAQPRNESPETAIESQSPSAAPVVEPPTMQPTVSADTLVTPQPAIQTQTLIQEPMAEISAVVQPTTLSSEIAPETQLVETGTVDQPQSSSSGSDEKIALSSNTPASSDIEKQETAGDRPPLSVALRSLLDIVDLIRKLSAEGWPTLDENFNQFINKFNEFLFNFKEFLSLRVQFQNQAKQSASVKMSN